MKLEPLIEMPCMTSGLWRRFGVHVFEGKLTIDDMERLDREGQAWFQKNPGKLVELVIIFPSQARMTAEERARMAVIIKRRESSRTSAATVILATGLVGAAQRSVLTGLLFLAPPPHPSKVCGTTDAAVDWLAPAIADLCGPEATPSALRQAVNDLCDGFRRRGPISRSTGASPLT